MSENTMSKSQAKRKARLEESQKAKRDAKRGNLIANLAILIIVAIFAVAIGGFIYTKATTTTSSSDYSAFLQEDGTIRGVNPTDYVEALDYKNITIPAAEVTYTEEEMQAAINSALSQNKELIKDTSLSAVDGDTLNIDFVGKVDGVEFEGGSTNGTGTDLTIGSGSYVDTFETQLIGAHPGDQVLVKVTFPQDYATTDLQGKDAEFEVTVNGIYVTPEFTDEFVAANLSDKASTMEEYRTYLKETNESAKLDTYISNYLQENAASKATHEGHVKYLKAIGKYDQETYYNSYNQTYIMMTGAPAFNSFSEFTGMSNSEFEDYLQEEAVKRSTLDMTYQYIFTDAGLSISEEDYQAKVEVLGAESVQNYGKAYVMQMILQDKVLAYLSENVKVQ